MMSLHVFYTWKIRERTAEALSGDTDCTRKEQLPGDQAWNCLALNFLFFTVAEQGTSVCLNPKQAAWNKGHCTFTGEEKI